MERKYVIIPGCSDLNRGDQALVWETKRFAEKCGYIGEFYLTTEANEPVEQSTNEGLKIIKPVIEHPSRIFKNKSNIEYTASLKIKWGLVSVIDLICSLMLLFPLTRQLANVFLSKEKKKSLAVFNEADAVFIKGGGLLQAYGGITSTYSMYFWCYHIFLAHALKKPIFMMPNSLGPFDGPMVKAIAKKAMKCCKTVTAREKLSEKMVKNQLGIDIPTFPDLAFALNESEIDRDSIFAKYDLPYDRKLVSVTMRPYRFPKSDNPAKAYESFKNEMKKFILWLYDNGYMAVVIEHTLALNTHENDGSCIKEVLEGIDNRKYRFISDPSYNCRDLKAIYGMFDYIVGTRFHSVIFSLGKNVPGLAICYVGNKAQGIMKDIGLEEYAVSIYDVTAEILEKKFSKLVNNKDEVVDKIKEYNNNVGDKLQLLMKLCTE